MMLFISINACNLYIVLFSIYMFLKDRGADTMTGYLLLLLTVIALGYFIYVQLRVPQPKILKWLSILFYMFAIYGIVYILFGDVIYDYAGPLRKIDYLKKIAAYLLPIYPFYVFLVKDSLKLSS